jgi:hypothetical protein
MSKIVNSMPPGTYNISIESDMACSDCNQYAADLQSIFLQPPWSVRMPMVGGPGKGSTKGMALLTPDPNDPLPEAKTIGGALTAAGIPFDLMAGADRLIDPAHPVAGPPPLIAAIVLTARVSP